MEVCFRGFGGICSGDAQGEVEEAGFEGGCDGAGEIDGDRGEVVARVFRMEEVVWWRGREERALILRQTTAV